MDALTLDGDPQGVLVRPVQPNGLGLLVLTGSSGRVDEVRARLFAEHGAIALAQRWWGGRGQPRGICEIALETFFAGLDRLQAEGCTRLAVLGVSRGAEAALLTAAHDTRVDAVIAISPTHVVWSNFGPGDDGQVWPSRSAWRLRGAPLPFVALDPRWRPPGPPPVSFVGLHETSLATFAEDVPAATLPVERIRGEILLVAGGADALWPSSAACAAIVARCAEVGKTVRCVEHPLAGHRPLLPGEPLTPRPADRAWGGTDVADRALGAAAWIEIERLLALPRTRPGPGPGGEFRPATDGVIRFTSL